MVHQVVTHKLPGSTSVDATYPVSQLQHGVPGVGVTKMAGYIQGAGGGGGGSKLDTARASQTRMILEQALYWWRPFSFPEDIDTCHTFFGSGRGLGGNMATVWSWMGVVRNSPVCPSFLRSHDADRPRSVFGLINSRVNSNRRAGDIAPRASFEAVGAVSGTKVPILPSQDHGFSWLDY